MCRGSATVKSMQASIPMGSERIGIRFQERMAGSISLEHPDEAVPFEFEVHVFTQVLFNPFIKRAIRGVAKIDTQEIPLEGWMQITPAGVAYDFQMDLGNRKLRAAGKKRYNWLSLLKNPFYWRPFNESLITLPLNIFEGNQAVGKALLRYLNPLWQFPLTFRFVSHRYAFDSGLSVIDRWVGMAPQMIPGFQEFTSEDEFRARLRIQYETLSPLMRASVSLLTRWPLYVFARAELHSAFIKSAIFSSPSYLRKHEQTVPEPPKQIEEERWKSLIFTPKKSRETLEVDVVIVGSGAGGAAAALEFSKRGLAVAILEDGRYHDRREFTGDRLAIMRKLYHKGGFQFAVGNTPIWLPTGRGVGGTTTINAGTSFRTPDRVIKRWHERQGLDLSALKDEFDEVEHHLRVKPAPKNLHGPVHDLMQKGLDKDSRGEVLESLPRAEESCDGQGFCILGCPTGAKRSADVSLIPEALKNGAHLFTGLEVHEILFDSHSHGQRAVGVRAGVSDFGDEFDIEIKANTVVLAAGALKTPALLWAAGLAESLPQLGNNLSIHPAVNISAIFDHSVRQRFYIPQSMGVMDSNDEANRRRFVLESYTMTLDTIPMVLPFLGEELSEIMRAPTHYANFSAMLEDSQLGSLYFYKSGASYTRNGFRNTTQSLPLYHVDRDLLKRMGKASAWIGRLFLHAGAREVITPAVGFERIRTQEQLRSLEFSDIPAGNWRYLSAHHPLGTCRMGTHPSNSVVDVHGKVWGIEGLYIVDGSVIPGPLGVNPQVTIMANAQRISKKIANEI